jgi:hypothetical protein
MKLALMSDTKYFKAGNGNQIVNQKLAKRLIDLYLPESNLDVHCYTHPVAAMMVATRCGYDNIKAITDSLPWLEERSDKRLVMLRYRKQNLKAYYFEDGNVIATILGIGAYTSKASANWDEIEKLCKLSFTIPHSVAMSILNEQVAA